MDKSTKHLPLDDTFRVEVTKKIKKYGFTLTLYSLSVFYNKLSQNAGMFLEEFYKNSSLPVTLSAPPDTIYETNDLFIHSFTKKLFYAVRFIYRRNEGKDIVDR